MTICKKCNTVSYNILGACEKCYSDDIVKMSSREEHIENELIEIKRLLIEKVLPLLSRIDRNI